MLFKVYVGLISYGIGHIDTDIASWKLLFIILGGISLLFSIAMFFMLPDRPGSGSFLNEKEAFIAVDRKKEDNTGAATQVRSEFVDGTRVRLLTSLSNLKGTRSPKPFSTGNLGTLRCSFSASMWLTEASTLSRLKLFLDLDSPDSTLSCLVCQPVSCKPDPPFWQQYRLATLKMYDVCPLLPAV